MNDRTMVQEHEIAARRGAVFTALTDARELERWWTTQAQSEPKKGGAFHYQWLFPDVPERNHVQEGRYEEVKQDESLAYPWKAGPADTRVRFELRDAGEGTMLRLEHAGWSPEMEEAYAMHEQGWGFFLGNLKTYLEEGVDRRSEMMGIQTVG